MAIDHWLFQEHYAGRQPSCLRFYCWSPVAISLGHHQQHIPPHWQHLTWQGQPVALVRRPTGGRAVLHQGDLTYTVVTSGLEGDRGQVYKALCHFLIEGFRRLNLELRYGKAGRGYIHNPDCFGTATVADLVRMTGKASGEKFIGSAQLRRGNCILQHGSIRLEPDLDLLRQVFQTETLPQSPLPLRPKGEPLVNMIMNALIPAAGACFSANLIATPLSEAEWQAISVLSFRDHDPPLHYHPLS